MAAVTHGVTTASTTGGASVTSGSFTPVAGDLLVVTVLVTLVTGPSPTLTASANGITFTAAQRILLDASADMMVVFVADQLVPASPAAMTVTAGNFGGSATGSSIVVERVSGMTRAGTAAVRQVGGTDNNVAAAGTPSESFAAAALTGNVVLGAVANNTNPATLTPPASFTERADVGFATPVTGHEVVTRDSGHTSATVTWGSTSATRGGVIIVELDTSAASTAFSGSADLSGDGSLTASSTLDVSGSAALSGTGSLAPSASLAVTGAAALSGDGSLTAAAAPGGVAAVSLSGAGTLTRLGVPAVAIPSGFGGDGTLTAAGTPAPAGPGALAGIGTLAAAGGQVRGIVRDIALVITVADPPWAAAAPAVTWSAADPAGVVLSGLAPTGSTMVAAAPTGASTTPVAPVLSPWSATQPYLEVGSTVAVSIPAVSKEYLHVPVTASVTLDTQPIELAFLTTGTPGGSTTWTAAEWEGSPGTTRTARLLIGPTAFALSAGTYTVWVRVSDTTEIPVRSAGQIIIT